MQKQSSIKEKIISEIEVLPENKVKQVADFISFLKSKENKKRRWDMLCLWGKKFAKSRGIKESDVLKEISKSRYNLG